MLLPALNQARESAKKSACANQLKTLLSYMQLYTVDNDDYIPIAYGNTETVNYATIEASGRKAGIPQYVGYSWNEGSYAVMSGKKSLYMCPSAKSGNSTEEYFNRLNYGFNRYYNYSFAGTLPKITKIKKASSVFILLETLYVSGYTIYPWEAIQNARPYGYQFGQHHNGFANIGYFDGHVGSWQGIDPELSKAGIWKE